MKKFLILFLILALMLPTMLVLAEAVDAAPAVRVNIDLTQIALALLSLLAAWLTARVIPWIKAGTTDAQQAVLESVARIGVYAAEQLYGALEGDKKLNYVQAYLKAKGYDVNTDEVKNTIEAMVKEMNIMQQQEVFVPPDM